MPSVCDAVDSLALWSLCVTDWHTEGKPRHCVRTRCPQFVMQWIHWHCEARVLPTGMQKGSYDTVLELNALSLWCSGFVGTVKPVCYRLACRREAYVTPCDNGLSLWCSGFIGIMQPMYCDTLCANDLSLCCSEFIAAHVLWYTVC